MQSSTSTYYLDELRATVILSGVMNLAALFVIPQTRYVAPIVLIPITYDETLAYNVER